MIGWKSSPHSDPENYIKTSLGYSHFPKEAAIAPKAWAATTGNLVFYSRKKEVKKLISPLISMKSNRSPQGGHFAAWEKPELLLKDVEDFIGIIQDNI
jgi:microsomal epoxide hydrolase